MNAPITCTGCRHAYDEAALYCPNCGRPKVREAVTDALVGKVLGDRFEVLELIGQGASGTIYRGEHVTLRRKVALKVLHAELSRDDLAVERFRREATTVAEIDNEHIVEIHDFGRTPDGRLYLAMELLEGETLDGVLAKEKTLSVEKVADILIQVGEALMEAHAIGYVHRDLRPRNVYLAVRRGKANWVKLLDFGLAKLVETDAQAASTSLGMTFGDPRYMSPEQARGDRIDRRADIYQLGCVAYEMLTGSPPFTGNRVFDILTKQVAEIPAPLPTRRPGVPLWMEQSVAKMLAKDPDNRFATTTRMVDALRRGLETGEVMDDDIARRRESVPPPSVSRVMQRMGLSQPVDVPREALPPGATVTGVGVAPAPAPASKPKAEIVAEVVAPRRRTGTPEVGVPAVEVQPPVTGLIDKPSGRTKRATSQGLKDPMGISQAWYDEGDDESIDAERLPRARKNISASTTDLSMYDEPITRRRWPIVLGLLAGLGAVAGTIAFAMSRSDGEKKPAAVASAPPPAPLPAPTEGTPPPPSQIIAEPAGSAAKVAPVVAETPKHPTATPVSHETHEHVAPSKGGGGDDDVNFGAEDPGRRRPTGLGLSPTPTPTPPPTNVVITPPVEKKGPTGVSGSEGPQDPYGGGPAGDPGDGAAPDKKAEFYANLGESQLASGDTAGAAASFKKAMELDAKNANAVIGMGEIALRQGLFGDAIAHLKRASRMMPKSSRVFTLLGDAYLNSGQNSVAADNYKKALQLDPDNAKARDGYNEASSRVPPPQDD
jgi:tRNA A-37 threonylcarbamoyl transferase component Bud32/TolA-binding protein